MKRIVLALSVAGTAFAAGSKVSFKQFKKVALEAEQTLENTGDDCHFAVTETSKGIRLAIDSDRGNVFVHFPVASKIILESEDAPDGSYRNTHKVKGIGTFTIIHEDDAYDLVELESELVHNQETCSIYY